MKGFETDEPLLAVREAVDPKEQWPAMKGFETRHALPGRTRKRSAKEQWPAMKGFETGTERARGYLPPRQKSNGPL